MASPAPILPVSLLWLDVLSLNSGAARIVGHTRSRSLHSLRSFGSRRALSARLRLTHLRPETALAPALAVTTGPALASDPALTALLPVALRIGRLTQLLLLALLPAFEPALAIFGGQPPHPFALALAGYAEIPVPPPDARAASPCDRPAFRAGCRAIRAGHCGGHGDRPCAAAGIPSDAAPSTGDSDHPWQSADRPGDRTATAHSRGNRNCSNSLRQSPAGQIHSHNHSHTSCPMSKIRRNRDRSHLQSHCRRQQIRRHNRRNRHKHRQIAIPPPRQWLRSSARWCAWCGDKKQGSTLSPHVAASGARRAAGAALRSFVHTKAELN
ncbi:hypothetical protein C7451_106236 [Blastomonas natatoria]|uniref:Uncharacterized protein n=1 Tax=Blastomonas natatoria TaxID=34015 RepID=A0A2V3V3K4_9SPHN|nr:hypothetical protein C7451_106236 [Blastomonas natatoria]